MNNEKAFAEELRKRYTNNPPEGMTAKDILNYYFNLEDEDTIITGKAKSASSNVRQD